MKKLIIILPAIAALLYPFQGAFAGDGPGMYTRPKRTGTGDQPVALTYAIEVVRDGKVSKVPDSYAFRSGDNVRFHVQSNTDGYLYILASGAEGGQFDVISPDNGGESSLNKGQDYRLPKQGVKIADNRSMKLVFSKTKLGTEHTRSISFLAVADADTIDSAVSGAISPTKPTTGFENESSTTIKVIDPDKPLGIEITLGADSSSPAKSSEAGKQPAKDSNSAASTTKHAKQN